MPACQPYGRCGTVPPFLLECNRSLSLEQTHIDQGLLPCSLVKKGTDTHYTQLCLGLVPNKAALKIPFYSISPKQLHSFVGFFFSADGGNVLYLSDYTDFKALLVCISSITVLMLFQTSIFALIPRNIHV